MSKRIKIGVATAGAIVLAVAGGGFLMSLPAQAATDTTKVVHSTTTDGETNDDGVEDGTNDGETADDQTGEVEDGTNDGETADDQTGEVEDGTNDGETADDGPAGK